MARSRLYYTLIGSLPALPAHFEQAERVPITSPRLDERLKMLDGEDAAVVEQMADFLVWDRQPLDRTDDDYCEHYDRFMAEVQHAFARELIEAAMTRRTIVCALRRRRLQLGPPAGVGWAAAHVARNWERPDFRLAVRFPWIPQVDAQLNGSMPFEVERMLLGDAWHYVKRLADQYQFSFEAVVLYLIRWEIVHRWVSRDAEAGREKFEQLAADAMGEFARMFENSAETTSE